MKSITLFFTALAFFLGSCERHDWDDTKKLYEHDKQDTDHSEKEGDQTKKEDK